MRKNLYKNFKYSFLLIFGFFILFNIKTSKVYAAMTLSPDPGTSIPASYRDYLRKCDEYSPLYSPAFAQWISSTTDRTQTSFDVPYGTAYVDLRHNLAAAVCSTRSAVTDTRYQVTGASPSGVSNIVGDVETLNFNPPNSLGLYTDSFTDFTFGPSGGFTSSATYTITIKTKGVNRFTAGNFKCIGGAGIPTTSLTNITPCEETSSTFTIQINVLDSPPTISLSNVDCANKNVTLNVSDPDGSPVKARYSVDGVWSGWFWVPGSTTIDMSSYDQYDIHSVVAETNGTAPGGGDGSINKTASISYRNSGNRACIDRGFTTDASASQPVLLPGDDDPQKARFDASVSATFSHGGGPGKVKDVTLVRNWFIRKQDGTVVPLVPAAGNVTMDAPGSNSSTRNPLAPVPLPGDQVCNSVHVTPSSGTIDTTGAIVSGSGNSTESEQCILVVAKPYFRAYGGDVSAGFTASCSGWTTVAGTSKIIGYNDNSGKGSATQLAAFALSGFNGFTTATGRTVDPKPSKGLTFSNLGGTYGQPFNAGFCPPDYYALKSSTTIPLPIVSVDVSTLLSGTYEYTGNKVVTSLLPIANGKKMIIYIKGDAYIANNISYNTVGWTSTGDIPNFTLIVKGNIYISKDVDKIDGFYVVQPDLSAPPNTTGQVHTCGFSDLAGTTYRKPTALELNNECMLKQLKLSGSILAKRIRVQRTIGSLKNSDNLEPRTSATAAEQFIFGPESWVSPLFNGSGPTQYDTITALPPVL